jgi:hypothetical protein
VAEDPSPYKGLRDMAFQAAQIRGISGVVAAIVIDIPADGGYATIAGFADDTTSLYTSTGGGTLGAGNFLPVAKATRQLLNAAAAQMDTFAETDSGGWPPPGNVRFHVVTAEGNRYLDIPETSYWGREIDETMPLTEAAQGVVTAIRMVQDAQSTLPNGATRLMAAAQQGDIASIEHLIDYGARLEAQDAKGYTPLMYAANGGRDAAVRLLLEHGADSNAKDRQSSTPLMFAAQGGHAQMAQALLDSGADPNIQGTHGLTALGFAQQNGHSETAQILLDAQAT